jgi:hypothetical protein
VTAWPFPLNLPAIELTGDGSGRHVAGTPFVYKHGYIPISPQASSEMKSVFPGMLRVTTKAPDQARPSQDMKSVFPGMPSRAVTRRAFVSAATVRSADDDAARARAVAMRPALRHIPVSRMSVYKPPDPVIRQVNMRIHGQFTQIEAMKKQLSDLGIDTEATRAERDAKNQAHKALGDTDDAVKGKARLVGHIAIISAGTVIAAILTATGVGPLLAVAVGAIPPIAQEIYDKWKDL